VPAPEPALPVSTPPSAAPLPPEPKRKSSKLLVSEQLVNNTAEPIIVVAKRVRMEVPLARLYAERF
jgi:hypothetical protein